MNFEERVERIANKKYLEQLEVFQDSADRTSDLMKGIEDLLHTIPLIEDIKTEVANIQKTLGNKPDKEDEEDKEKKQPREPLDPTTENEVLQLLEDLTNLLPYGSDLPKMLPNGKSVAPYTGGSSAKDFFTPKDALRFALWLQRKWKELKKYISDEFQDRIAQGKFDELVLNAATTNQTVNRLNDYVHSELIELSSQLRLCCQTTADALDAIGQDTQYIRRKINDLDPAADANKDLALQSRARAILAEVQGIRGLL